ncbi:hypothetical protein J6R97_08810 [bacterium]|nr:hypothetical protein [bacterium]
MRINNIQNSYSFKTNPSFQSFQREIVKPNKGLLYCNDTCFFRNASFWDQLTCFLKEKYKNEPKVNVYNYGCSDGSESLSLVMKILTQEDKELEKKFLPVIAKDIDEFVISKAKSKEFFYLKNDERKKINFYTNGQYRNFFSEIDETNNGCFALANNDLYKHIDFSVADIRSDYKNIEPENSVVFVRNFWPYITKRKNIISKIKDLVVKSNQEVENKAARQEILDNLASQLEKKSLIIIGNYDLRGTLWSIEDEIQKAGFKKTNLKYVFEKI